LVAPFLIFWEPPAPVVSISMSVVLRDAMKLLVNTDFGGILTVAEVGKVLVDFLAVCEVLLVMPLASFYFPKVVIPGP
jgi:hypothetical protein